MEPPSRVGLLDTSYAGSDLIEGPEPVRLFFFPAPDPLPATPELPTLIAALGGMTSTDLLRFAHPLTIGATVGYTVDSGVNAHANQWGGHDPQNPTRERLDYLRVLDGSGFRLTLVSIAVMGDPLDPREQPRTRQCFDPDLGSDGWVEANQSLRCYFSDHYGVEAVLRLERMPP
jgi:hypothetical protein